jgi:hypothetical protein
MATGLTRNKNLSEKNLNLKNALQKLYAPGIENDIELFSLSSDIDSVIISGPSSDKSSQIIGFKTEYIKNVLGESIPRTKFVTKFFTYTDSNKVYFKEFEFATGFSEGVKSPIKSTNGSIVNTNLYSGGDGYYFTDIEGNPLDLGTSQNIIVNNVKLKGRISKSESAICSLTLAPGNLLGKEATYSNTEIGISSLITVTISGQHLYSTGDRIYFTPTSGTLTQGSYAVDIQVVDQKTITFFSPTTSINTNETCVITPSDELDRFSPEQSPPPLGIIDGRKIPTRYKIINVSIFDGGEQYLEGENLEVIPGIVDYNGTLVNLNKQIGILYSGTSEILKTDNYYYEVRGADLDGFYLIDTTDNKYVFLDIDTGNLDFNTGTLGALELRRSDAVSGDSFSYFKLMQSPVYLRGLVDAYRVGDESISSEINRVSTTSYEALSRLRLQLQNTKKPTLSSDRDNELGYTFNSFEGSDGIFWQRVVVRDQDYLLNPTNGVTSVALKEDIVNFTLPNGIKVPGLYIIFGSKYVRAFSTTDKPFLSLSLGRVLNPSIFNNGDKSISAEDTQDSGVSWYDYESRIGEVAQRINSNGKDGAIYYHKLEYPAIDTISVSINNAQQNAYLVPMFKLI